MSLHKPDFLILGAGSWGTALAIQIAKNQHTVRLWDIDTQLILTLQSTRENSHYLPGIMLPEKIAPIDTLNTESLSTQVILICVPSSAFRDVLIRLKEHEISQESGICWATKGLDSRSGGLLHQVAIEVLGSQDKLAVISGPTFAIEVAKGLPTAITVASQDDEFANTIVSCLHSKTFRPYASNDIVGVEVGGAVKNVLAVAAGISDGLGFGANARTGLITRGLFEMTQLGVALGGKPETFTGLSGMGDLILTCTDNTSRNRRLGLALGQGRKIDETVAEIGQAVESIRTAQEVIELARKHHIDMPICQQVFEVLHRQKPPQNAVKALLERPLTSES